MGYLIVGKYTPENEEDNMPEVIEREHYGQGMIFKDEEAYKEHPDWVCYVPELSDSTYTRADFLNLCDGNVEMADELFDNCDWQHPESLIEDWVVNGEWEKCERCGILFDCQIHDSCTNCGNPVLSDEAWHVEKWHEEDLIAAMEKAGAHITRTNLDKMKDACKGIFDDKTARNEMLEDKAHELFGREGKNEWDCS